MMRNYFKKRFRVFGMKYEKKKFASTQKTSQTEI